MSLSGYVYTCSAGETFDSVSLALYKQERYACDLMAANPSLCQTSVFTGGEKLSVPVVSTAAAQQGGKYMPEAAPWK